MPIRIRRPNVRDWLKRNVRGVVQRTAEDLADAFLSEIRVEFTEEPHDPFWQLEQICPQCGLRIYESGNGITVCLACWIRFDADRAASQSQSQQLPRQRQQPGPSRTFKVRRARPRRQQQQQQQHRPPPAHARVPQDVAAALGLLGLADPATTDDVKKRRRELAFIHHPDRGGDVAKLIAVNQAAGVLLDFYSPEE